MIQNSHDRPPRLAGRWHDHWRLRRQVRRWGNSFWDPIVHLRGWRFLWTAVRVAAGFGSDQRIFAAFRDVPKNRIDVWASPDGVGPFVRLPDPFPGMSMASHPRMAYDQANGDLIVAAIGNDHHLRIASLVIRKSRFWPVIPQRGSISKLVARRSAWRTGFRLTSERHR